MADGTTERPQVTVVVPLYDEVDNVRPLCEEVRQVLDAAGLSWELVLVDDGSGDGTLEVLLEEARRDSRIRALSSPSNRGQSAALVAGLRAATGRRIVTLDGDLQNPPDEIPRLLAALDGSDGEEWDMVSGVRQERRDGWVRRLSSRVANRVRNGVVHDGMSDIGCSLKAYRAEVLRDLPLFDGMHRFLPALVRMRGGRIREIPVRHRPRLHGRSKYGIGNRLWRSLVDLCGVRWLQARHLAIEDIREIGRGADAAAVQLSVRPAEGGGRRDAADG